MPLKAATSALKAATSALLGACFFALISAREAADAPALSAETAKCVGQNAEYPFTDWKAGTVVTENDVARVGESRCFSAQPIPDDVFKRMLGQSFPEGCSVKRADLRYIRLLHVTAEGKICLGELVCNAAIAADLVSIFRTLYAARYPIESVRLIDDFDASDARSMEANNTSAFCFRRVAGSGKLSNHSRGLAVDVNPRYNPHVRTRSGRTVVNPASSRRYADRTQTFPYKITPYDRLVQTFKAHGFTWGGDWRTSKDYQHFEKALK